MATSNLKQLLVHELRDLYSAETQISEALPVMIEAANNEKLVLALQKHLDQTKEQIKRLDMIAQEVEFMDESNLCEGMQGIIADGEKGLDEIFDNATKDAAIIAAAQRVEHYEISAYGTAEEYARKLGIDESANLLKKTLEEEKKTDAELSMLAKGNLLMKGINEEAMPAGMS